MALGGGYYVRKGRVYKSRSYTASSSGTSSRWHKSESKSGHRSRWHRSSKSESRRRRHYISKRALHRGLPHSKSRRASAKKRVEAWNKLFKSLGKKTRISYAKRGYTRRYHVAKDTLPTRLDVGKTVKDLVEEREKAWDKVISGEDRSPTTIVKAVGLSLLPLDLANTIRKAVQGEKVTVSDVAQAGLDLLMIPLAPLRGVGVAIKGVGAGLRQVAKRAVSVILSRVAKSTVKVGGREGGKMLGVLSRMGLRAGTRMMRKITPKVMRRITFTTARRVIPKAARMRRAIVFASFGLGAFGAGAMLGMRASGAKKEVPPEVPPYVPEQVVPFVQPVEDFAQQLVQPLEQVPFVGELFAEARKRNMVLPLLAIAGVGGYFAYKKLKRRGKK